MELTKDKNATDKFIHIGVVKLLFVFDLILLYSTTKSLCSLKVIDQNE